MLAYRLRRWTNIKPILGQRYVIPASTWRWPNVVLLLARRLRRRSNIRTTLSQCLVLAGWLSMMMTTRAVAFPVDVRSQQSLYRQHERFQRKSTQVHREHTDCGVHRCEGCQHTGQAGRREFPVVIMVSGSSSARSLRWFRGHRGRGSRKVHEQSRGPRLASHVTHAFIVEFYIGAIYIFS